MKVLLVLPLLLLTACSAGGEDSLASSGPPASVLAVELDRGDGTPAEQWSLDCNRGTVSTHPDAEAACAALQALDDPFVPLPEDMMCTQVWGGPQSARVSGTWSGAPVDLTVLRTDGCQISQWDGLVPLLPAAS